MKELAFALAATLVLALPAAALEAPRKTRRLRHQGVARPRDEARRWRRDAEVDESFDVPVAELRFHLYWNAFRNDRSTFNRESGGQLRGDKVDVGKGWGYTDVTSLKWDGAELDQERAFRVARRRQPRRPHGPRRPAPAPRRARRDRGARDRVEGQGPEGLRARRLRARLLHVRTVVPADRRLRAEGPPPPRRAGWNCHQYHANSEFYADWGDWRVAITLPEKFVVGSAGALVSETKAGGKKTLTYEQKAVHNFAFTADPRYVVVDDVFDPAKDIPKDEIARAARTLGRTESELLAGFHKVAIRLYLPARPPGLRPPPPRRPEVGARVDRPLGVPVPVRADLDRRYARGRPWVRRAWSTRRSTRRVTFTWMARWPFDRLFVPETVTIHEFTHGYWMGLVASNEFEESWMDEGINTFTELRHGGPQVRASYLRFRPAIGVHERGRSTAPWPSLTQDHDPILSPSRGSYANSELVRAQLVPADRDDDPADPPPPRRGDVLARVPRLRRALALRPPDVGGLLRLHAGHRGPSSSRTSSGKTWYGPRLGRLRDPRRRSTGPGRRLHRLRRRRQARELRPDPKKKAAKKPDDKTAQGPVAVARHRRARRRHRDAGARRAHAARTARRSKRTWDGASELDQVPRDVLLAARQGRSRPGAPDRPRPQPLEQRPLHGTSTKGRRPPPRRGSTPCTSWRSSCRRCGVSCERVLHRRVGAALRNRRLAGSALALAPRVGPRHVRTRSVPSSRSSTTGAFRDALVKGWDSWAIRVVPGHPSDRAVGVALAAVSARRSSSSRSCTIFLTGGVLRALIARHGRAPSSGSSSPSPRALFKANLWATLRFALTASVLDRHPRRPRRCAILSKLGENAAPHTFAPRRCASGGRS